MPTLTVPLNATCTTGRVLGIELLTLGHVFPRLLTNGDDLNGKVKVLSDLSLQTDSESLVAGCSNPVRLVENMFFLLHLICICSEWLIAGSCVCHRLSQDKDLNRIAGNTISCPVIGSLLGIALAGWAVERLSLCLQAVHC